MKIEVLYPKLCNLFGDSANMRYLKECLPKATFYYTEINDEPIFVKENVDMIYLGSMSENTQELVIERLMPYKNRIRELIENNVIILATGNAFEIFGNYISNDDNPDITGLGIFDIYAKRDMKNRHNSLFLGTFKNMKIVGFKSQFSQTYGDNDKSYFADVTRGIGINPNSAKEGIMRNNFIGTYITGPLLVLNPLFVIYIMKKLGVKEPKLAFEEDIMRAYNKRLEEFEDSKTKI